MSIFIVLIVIMVLMVHTNGNIDQILLFKYMQFSGCYLDLNNLFIEL